jgi:hypothetical protein
MLRCNALSVAIQLQVWHVYMQYNVRWMRMLFPGMKFVVFMDNRYIDLFLISSTFNA